MKDYLTFLEYPGKVRLGLDQSLFVEVTLPYGTIADSIYLRKEKIDEYLELGLINETLNGYVQAY